MTLHIDATISRFATKIIINHILFRYENQLARAEQLSPWSMKIWEINTKRGSVTDFYSIMSEEMICHKYVQNTGQLNQVNNGLDHSF